MNKPGSGHLKSASAPSIPPRSPPPVPGRAPQGQPGSYLVQSQIAEHAAALVVPRHVPAPTSVPPPGPIIQSDPLSDLPTRPLALPPEPVALELSPLLEPLPNLSVPPSWPDDEGTAALLLTEPTPLPRPGVRLPESRRQPKSSWPKRLFAGILGVVLGAVLILGGLRFLRNPLKEAPLSAAGQQLIDDALRAVQRGQLDKAAELLQRVQSDTPNAAIESMIRSLRQQSSEKNVETR